MDKRALRKRLLVGALAPLLAAMLVSFSHMGLSSLRAAA